MTLQLPNLIPPFRYAIVEDGLFRGGYLKPRHIRFLKRLKLKTVLSLIPEKLIPEMQEFCEQQHIRSLHLSVDRMKEDNIPLSYNKTLMALQIMIDPANHPLYVHCLDGADVTGLVVACLRKLQMWSTSSAMGEFSRNLHTNVISPEEFEFVENFKNFEVTIPLVLPGWLWGGQVTFRKHTMLRLKFLNPDMMTEEERELKDLKEKREKEKEDYYKKRKNDLLDNLFDPSASGGQLRHHRTPSHFTQTTNGNKDSSDDESDRDHDKYHNSGSSSSSNSGSSITGHVNSTAAANTAQNTAPENRAAKESVPAITMTESAPLAASSGQDIPLSTAAMEVTDSKEGASRSKERYLVDVDVDVDGVMMDGLDQVEYYNRTSSYLPEEVARSARSTRFYDRNDEERESTAEDENEDVSGTWYSSEPISRTLEALALEGLND